MSMLKAPTGNTRWGLVYGLSFSERLRVQFFIHFNAHPSPLYRQWHQDILVYYVGSIGQRRLNILVG